MNFINTLALIGALFVTSLQAKMVPFQEDAYMQQAPENLIALAEKAATAVDFTSDYEVIAPKKAGIEINPWNKFIGYGSNPVTHNPFVTINPEWFSNIPEDQQLFLLGRNFLFLKYGVTPKSFTIIHYGLIIISLLLLILVFYVLGKTTLKNQKIWVKILIAGVLVGAFESLVLNSLEVKLKHYYGKLYDQEMHERAVQKFGSRQSAIQALEFLDASLKDEIKKGETLFKPYENLFENYAQSLKK